MKKNFFGCFVVIILATLASGCVKTIDGHVKAGVPLIKDKITSRYERPVSEIFPAAKEVLSLLGKLNREDTINKTLEAKVNTRTVFVKVEEEDPTITRVTTQVRSRGGISDIDLASEVDKQIALRLLK